MKAILHPSTNFSSRKNHAIDMLVLHYTGMKSSGEALERMCDETPGKRVSAHYMVDEDGTIYALVDEKYAAWHAGVSYWQGYTNINQRSIGVEIANPGHEFGYRPFPNAQMRAVIELCKQILARHPIPARKVVAHSDIAPSRKEDPGELFDWQWLAKEGVGLWPFISPASHKERGTDALAAYGYDTTDLPRAVLAFQRHFRPSLLNGVLDEECEARLAYLLNHAV